jgi:hypothetical protein
MTLNLILDNWGITIWANIDRSNTRQEGNIMSKSTLWRIALRWLKDRLILL